MKRVHEIAHFWHGRVPIRLRLTGWYLLSFGLIVLVFAIALERQLMAGLEKQSDTALRLAAIRATEYVAEDGSSLIFQQTDSLQDMDDDFSIYLLAPDQKTVWGHLGLEAIPVLEAPTQDSYFTVKHRGPLKGENEDENWRAYNQSILSNDGAVLGWLQTAQVFDRNHTLGLLRGHLCLAFPMILLLAAVGGIFLASRALRPIDQVTRTAQAINASDLQRRLNYQGPEDEVGRLARTFDSMLDRLQAGFERERRFTGDAAHELRTPLTALKGHIGVTLSQPRTPTEYAATLQDMEYQVDRLIHLSGDLLLMARLDYCKQHHTTESISLSDLLAALEDQIMPLGEAKALTVVSQIEPDLSVRGNMDLLIRLFLNLLDNAIKYTPHGGTITIHARRNSGDIQIAIRDSGPGIAPDQLPHLFERFYRVESDRARQHDSQSGAGLGLAIVQEIALIHQGWVTVESQMGQGSTFTIYLPA
jgi:heavy metal sensor kinase